MGQIQLQLFQELQHPYFHHKLLFPLYHLNYHMRQVQVRDQMLRTTSTSFSYCPSYYNEHSTREYKTNSFYVGHALHDVLQYVSDYRGLKKDYFIKSSVKSPK